MNQDDKNNKKGIDVSGSLKDSSSGVRFEGERQYARSYYSETPKIIQWVITYSGGYVKDEKQASYAILGFVGVAVIVSLFLIFGSGSSDGQSLEKKFPPGSSALEE